MNDHTITAIVSVLVAITGLAIIAVIVSQNSNTTGVFTAGGGAVSNALCAALAPVTGKSCKSLIPTVSSTINFGNVIP